MKYSDELGRPPMMPMLCRQVRTARRLGYVHTVHLRSLCGYV